MAEPFPFDPHEFDEDTDAAPRPPLPFPRLVRPGSDASTERLSGETPVTAPAAPPRWAPPAPSVPESPRTPPAPMAVGPSDRAREFPMDDADERAQVKQRLEVEAAEQARRAHEVVSPDEFESAGPPPPPWRQWLRSEELGTQQRRIVVLAALAVVLALVWGVSAWSGSRATPIGRLLRDPHQWADREVTVHGRVVDVFPVGASWAFTLVQGRDTVVVFTRSREPRPRQRLTVQGVVSTGVLDGQPHVAVFEATD